MPHQRSLPLKAFFIRSGAKLSSDAQQIYLARCGQKQEPVDFYVGINPVTIFTIKRTDRCINL